MLFEALGQIFVFLAFLWLGLCCGLICSVFSLTIKIRAKPLAIALECALVLLCGVLFLTFLTIYNLGVLRAYTILAFFVGLVAYKIFLHNFVAKFARLLYNNINKLCRHKAKRSRGADEREQTKKID